jgi:Holliday junction resolvase-like predicted endonuclease
LNERDEGKPLEKVLSGFDWSGFETAVAEIFFENGFSVKRNLRFKTGRRYEVDIIASRGAKVACVDCKEWREGRNKRGGIERAARMQKERTDQLKKFVSKNPIAQSSLKIGLKANCVPIIVTLFDEVVKENDDVLIVPVWKLNSLLNSDVF